MKICQYHEVRHDIRFELTFQTKNVELHSQLSDDLDLTSDIRAILQDANRTIAQLIVATPRKKECRG